MYNGESKHLDVPPSEQLKSKSSDSVLGRVHVKLEEINQRQSKYIYEIEEKLHSVINRRVGNEEQKPHNDCVDSVNDYNESVGRLFNHLDSNTNRLGVILSHLNEII